LRAFRLGVESHAVAGLRIFQAVTGRASMNEGARMIDEKVAALFQAHQAAFVAIATGHLEAVPHRVLRVYSRKVAANRRRLSGG
jgi:hypothetical protein